MGPSIRRIVQTLRPIQQITIKIGRHSTVATDPLTDTAAQILDAIKRSAPTH